MKNFITLMYFTSSMLKHVTMLHATHGSCSALHMAGDSAAAADDDDNDTSATGMSHQSRPDLEWASLGAGVTRSGHNARRGRQQNEGAAAAAAEPASAVAAPAAAAALPVPSPSPSPSPSLFLPPPPLPGNNSAGNNSSYFRRK